MFRISVSAVRLLTVVVFAFFTCAVLQANPAITSVSPGYGPVGTTVTLNGSGFGASQGTSTVQFGTYAATASTWTDTRIVTTVPSMPIGKVYLGVTVSGTTANTPFTVGNPPLLTGMSPGYGPQGTTITFSGSQFGATQGSSTITLGSYAMTPTSWSNTQIVAPVPSNAPNGKYYPAIMVGGLQNPTSAGPFTVGNPPLLSAMSPGYGPQGTVITFTGQYFGTTQGSSTIKLGTYTMTPTSWSDTQIVAPVPSSAANAKYYPTITVNGLQNPSSAGPFTVGNPPLLTGMSPGYGPQGTVVTFTGSQFGATQGSSTITLGSYTMTPTSWSDTQIVAPVPSNAANGKYYPFITVGGLQDPVSAGPFTVGNPPIINGVSPNSAPAGSSVTVTGVRFGASQGSSVLKFGTYTTTPTSWADTQIVTVLPSGMPPGNYYPDAIVGGLDTFTSSPFTVTSAPVLSSISPATGGIGATVTLTGSAFGNSQGQSTVRFNGIVATITNWGPSTITARVPAGLNPGTATITVNGNLGSSNGVQFTVTNPLFVTPNQVTMLVGQTRPMLLLDENGVQLNNPSWTFDNNSIAEIISPQNQGDPTLLQADAVGTVTLTATFGNRTGNAKITVLAADASFPIGTVQWEVPSLGTYGIVKTVQTVKVDENTPDLYVEDDGVYGGNGAIRALTANGQQKWIWPSTPSDKFPLLLAGDNQGGAIYFASQDNPGPYFSYCYFGRVDQNGTETWQYQESNCREDYAIAPDGTIFLVEDSFQNTETTVITALDPTTGQIKFTVPLPASTRATLGVNSAHLNPVHPEAVYCSPGSPGTTTTTPLSVHGAISVSSDGTAYIPFTTNASFSDAEPCDSTITTNAADASENGLPQRVRSTDGTWSSSTNLQMLVIHSDGSYSTQQLDANSASGTGTSVGGVSGFFGLGRAISDGQGSTLLTTSFPPALYHRTSKFNLPITPAVPFGDDPFSSDPALLGEKGIIYITGSSDPDGPRNTILAFDTSGGTTTWTSTVNHPDFSSVMSGASVVFQYAQADTSTHIGIIDSNAQVSPLFTNPVDGSDIGPILMQTGFGSHVPSYWGLGVWHTSTPDGGLAAVVGDTSSELENAPRPSAGGEPQKQNATNPTATITVRFTDSKSPGDQLNFGGAGACGQGLGLRYCPNVSWTFYVEGVATVSDDASKWRIRQNAVGTRAGNTKDTQGVLHAVSDRFNSNSIPGDDDPCIVNDSRPGCEGIVAVQQPSNQNTIFWLDHPGSLYQASSDAVWDSLTQNMLFTSKACNRFGICASVKWFVKLQVDPGSVMNCAQSLDGLLENPITCPGGE